ncbi:MAG: cyclic lactone autoinducer peptide [Lachnospiraceae bacterium]|nr:cyclic lactone autoinducer peptide [Lachnospiraceae bacterium]
MKQKIIKKISKVFAGILLKDIKLNANAASSLKSYEPPMPEAIKKYRRK